MMRSMKMADAMSETNEFHVGIWDTRIIVRTRLDMEEEFASGRRKKSVLWRNVIEKIKEQRPEFTMNKEEINRKYLNLLTTYRRIKARNKKSGRNATTWEFFEDFDEVYGHSVVVPPAANLNFSLNDTETHEQSSEPTEYVEGEPPSKKSRGSLNDILAYLKKESENEQKRHEDLMAMEERKLEVKEKRLNALLQIKEVLERNFIKIEI